MNVQLSVLNRILIIAGLFLIIAMLGYFFVFQPKTRQEAATRAEIADLQAQYDQLKRVADQKPLYIAFTNQIRARLKGVEITADPRTYIPSYLKQIESLAGQDGLVVTGVTPTATAPPSPGPSATPAGGVTRPNLPGAIAAPAGNITGALGAGNAASQQVPAAGGTAPVPGAGGASPVPGGPAGSVPAGQTNAQRAAALAYLNQSFTQVPIAMTFEGHYGSLERFLRDLAKFQKLIGVGDATLTSSETATGGSRLKITLPITAYRLSPNAPPSGPLVTPTPTPAPGGKR